MTDQYRVDLAHLDTVTAQLESLNGFVEELLRELEERIAVVQRDWSGAAADAHAATHAQWITAAAMIHGELAKVKTAAAAALSSYDAGTAANLSMLGRSGQ
ncbi:WXG100 family type VII secretion target [Nocardia tenerifensis]|uniref:WXG100 family type VII secretion target n=1 Tax=Nocardia tenerifensis TaxID=228006 RepID=A0A318K4Z1_9NOCA|nr:WXG100 family type VII secretion target [Nocardia tenerifensis]PXX66901.1 WXG100 family type VII secretion target [Nocardia tenerifensis]